MPELKYSYDSLQKFCEENGIELCKDYSNEVVNQKTCDREHYSCE